MVIHKAYKEKARQELHKKATSYIEQIPEAAPHETAVMLYFDLRPGQKCHSRVMHRKEVTHSNGSEEIA